MSFEAFIAGQVRIRQDASTTAFLAEEPGPVPEPPVKSYANRAPVDEYEEVSEFLVGLPNRTSPDGSAPSSGGDSQTSRQVPYDADHGNDTPGGYSVDESSDKGDLLDALAAGEYAGDIEQFWDDLADLDEPEPTCTPFAPPSDGGECPEILDEDWGDCAIPCTESPDQTCRLDQLPDTSDDFDYQWWDLDPDVGIDQNALDLVADAWKVLQANLDIVDWLTCLYYGETAVQDRLSFWETLQQAVGANTSVAQCLRDRINGSDPILIRFSEEVDKGAFITYDDFWDGWTIGIPRQAVEDAAESPNTWNDSYLIPYSRSAGSDSDQRFCLVADFASTMLHELLHSCTGWSVKDQGLGTKGENNSCATTYVLENSFRWALAKRYPCLGNVSACDFYFEDYMWGNDGASYPGSPPGHTRKFPGGLP